MTNIGISNVIVGVSDMFVDAEIFNLALSSRVLGLRLLPDATLEHMRSFICGMLLLQYTKDDDGKDMGYRNLNRI